MTTKTSQKTPLRHYHDGITFVNDKPTCAHKKLMVTKTNGKTNQGFWACMYPKDDGSCKRYLNFDEWDEVKPLLPHEVTQEPRTPRTPNTQKRITHFFMPTPPTGRQPESRILSDPQERDTDPTRRAIIPTPTRRTNSSKGGEDVISSGFASTSILGGKRPISPNPSENSPSKKHQFGSQCREFPTARVLFQPIPDNQAATAHAKKLGDTQPNENEPSDVVCDDKFGKKLSGEHVPSQASSGGSKTSRRVARVPLGDSDSNRV